MTRLEKMLEARRLINCCGEYDTGIAGAIAEVYAEEVLHMERAPRGERGYDGIINERKVQVKGKEYLHENEAASYVAIRSRLEGLADDLLLVYFDNDDKLQHLGPIAISCLAGTKTPTETRYYIHNIRQACKAQE